MSLVIEAKTAGWEQQGQVWPDAVAAVATQCFTFLYLHSLATARPFIPTLFFVVEDNGRTRFQPLHYTPIEHIKTALNEFVPSGQRITSLRG
jgi:hypothetical protein